MDLAKLATELFVSSVQTHKHNLFFYMHWFYTGLLILLHGWCYTGVVAS